MTINLCLVENKTRGMEPQWSPCKDFSLTDIETIVVWSVSFSIIWQRHWERIGKILSSNCKHVLKVRGEYQRICLHEVFIQLYKTGAGWICQLSIKEDLDFGRSFHSTRQVARLYNYCQLERTSNLAKFQLKLPRKYWICVCGGKKNQRFPKLCLHYFCKWFYFCQKWLGRGMNFSHASNWNCQENSESVHKKTQESWFPKLW